MYKRAKRRIIDEFGTEGDFYHSVTYRFEGASFADDTVCPDQECKHIRRVVFTEPDRLVCTHILVSLCTRYGDVYKCPKSWRSYIPWSG